MTPEAVAGASTASPPERYSDLAALVGESTDNLPGVPGVGPKTAAKWINQYGDLDRRRRPRRPDQGQGGGVAARAPRRRAAQPPAQPAGARPRRCRSPSPSWPARSGTASRCTRSSTAWSSGCCATGCSTTLEAVEAEAEGGFDVDGSVLAPSEVAGWLDEHAAPGARVGVTWSGAWGRGTGDAEARRASPRRTAPRPTSTLADARPAGARQALRAWLADPRRPKALHDAKGPMQALRGPGPAAGAGVASDTALAAYLVRPDQRSYDLADLVLRHLGRELRGRGRRPAARALLDFGADGDAAARRRDGAGPGRPRPGRRARHRSSRPPAAPRCCATSSCRSVDVLAGMERVGIAVDVEVLTGAGGRLRRRGARGRRATPTTRSAASRSTSARPSSCRWCCSTSSACPRPSAPRPATPPTPTR